MADLTKRDIRNIIKILDKTPCKYIAYGKWEPEEYKCPLYEQCVGYKNCRQLMGKLQDLLERENIHD